MAVALGAASLGGSAAAQTQYSVENPTPLPPERLGVLDRPRPGYDPIGLEWGPYYIFPRLDLSTTYDSNVFATPTNTQDDVSFAVRPEVFVVSNWPRHAVSFRAAAEERVYAIHGTEDVTNVQTALDGRLDITDDYVTGGIGYELGHEDRASPDNVLNQKNPIQYQVGTAFIRYVHEVGLIGFRVTGRIFDYGFDNGLTVTGETVPETYRDRLEYWLTPRVSYELYPGYYAFIQTPVNWRVYNSKFDIDGFQRSSHGYEVDAGVSFAIGGASVGEVFVGYIDQEFDDRRLKPARGVGFGGSVLWNVTDITSLRFALARTVEEVVATAVPNAVVPASSILQTAVTAGAEHELDYNVLLWGRVGFVDQDFQGTTRDDKIYFGQAGVRYLFNQYLNAGLDVDYHHRDSSFAIFNYDRVQVTARLRLQE